MLRSVIAIIFSTAIGLTIVEFYSIYHFSEYVEKSDFHQKAFNRLINSIIENKKNHPNNSQSINLLSPNTTRTIQTDEYTYTIESNSIGFRTQEIKPRKPNTYRILFFGDSMLFGVGQEQENTIAENIELFGNKKRMEVYNYSMLNFSTVESLIAAQTYSPQAEPDHILLGIFIANDPLLNALSYANDYNQLAYNSTQVKRIKQRLNEELSPFMWSSALRILALEAWVPRLRYRWSLEPDYLVHTYQAISEFGDIATIIGAEASIVVIYPNYAIANNWKGLWSGSRKLGRHISQHARSKDLKVLDLSDYMQGTTDAERYYYESDGHFNALGNKRVAELIYHHLLM